MCKKGMERDEGKPGKGYADNWIKSVSSIVCVIWDLDGSITATAK